MLPVSQEFMDKMKSIIRRVYGKIQIDYTDPFLDQSIQMEANENNNISYPQQTADNVQNPMGKIASLDGSWVLDGSYVLAPETNSEVYQIGWWGSQLSDVNGSFDMPYPTLTATFLSRPIQSLKVVGDTARQEYPINFVISLYDVNGEVVYIESVIDNTSPIWSKQINTITQIVKMELIITKWSHPNRQAKIMEFFTSIQETYEGEDILLIHLLEEREVANSSVPVGNISANEIKIKLNNETKKFDAGNTQSPLYETLKANRRIKAWLGIEKDDLTKELVPLGVFWSGDWEAPEEELYVSTTGRDRLEQLRVSTYDVGEVEINANLAYLAEKILIHAGLKQEEYWIDKELQNFIIPYAYLNSQSHREALRKIAEACLGQVYCDRYGVIRVEGPSYLENNSSDILEITQDNYFRKSNPLKWSQIINRIEVETQPLRPDVLQSVYSTNDPVNINAGETKVIMAYYNQSPCINAIATISGTGSISNVTYYAWGAKIEVYSGSTGTFTLNINAKPLKVLNKERIVAQDDASIIDNGLIRYEFPNNPLIQTREVAEVIANKLLQYYKDPRRDVEIDWRGNPALLLGDRVSVTDKNEINNYYVVKQDIDFSGALRAKLSGRRA